MKKKDKIEESISKEDMKKLKKWLRAELAEIWFDLYRKRASWSQG
tara:strand:- start:81 stop:215 length:135 start_codon:yes stop_codon:yes gene_type:complete